MSTKRTSMAVLAGTLCMALLAGACSSNSNNGSSGSPGGGGASLTGAGATFPDPVYEQWFSDFRSVEPDAKINYQAIGSGGGVQQFTAKTVDFGASDAPLQTDEISALPAPAVEIPTVLGGVAIAYNVSGLKTGLKLDGQTAADIFQGKITKWNDAAIAALNPGVTLPDEAISVVHRSDESGTTFVYTSWLASQSASWSSDIGADKAVQWPVGTGGDGNDGVAAAMTQTEGSIGYLSYDFAVTSNLGVAAIQTKDGSFVSPSVKSISLAGGALKLPITPTTNILNSTVPGAYPISTSTYLLIYKDQTDKTKGQTLVDFVYWALTQGSATVTKLNYSPLPSKVQKQALSALGEITSGGTPITPSSSVKS